MALYELKDIRNELDFNADYQETGSVAKAKKYVTAATRFLQRAASSASHQGASETREMQEIRFLKEEAQRYVNENDTISTTSTGVRFYGFQGFRG